MSRHRREDFANSTPRCVSGDIFGVLLVTPWSSAIWRSHVP